MGFYNMSPSPLRSPVLRGEGGVRRGSALFIIIAVFLITVFAIGGVFLWQSYVRYPDPKATDIQVAIEQGDGVKIISRQLKDKGLIPNRFFFECYVVLSQTQKNFQPGIFSLRPGMSYVSIVDALTSIQSQEVTVTIPEGYTLTQIGELLEEKGLVSMDEWISFVGEPRGNNAGRPSFFVSHEFAPTFSFLESKPTERSLEGYLFPDTYRFLKGSSAEEIVIKMLTNFQNKLTPQMQLDIQTQGRTIHDVVTLASIVEREVQTDADRPLVADLFWRRLKIGMLLQADSTVNYITGGKTPSITYADRDIDSPWNTYKYKGLPPGPISNPGLAALIAAIYPKSNTAFYFLTDSEGNVHYARTNEEQVVNKQRYLK